MTGFRMNFVLAISAVVFSTTLVHKTSAQNWPQWRGTNHDGISEATDVPTKWNPDSNIAWRIPMPGPAGSTPVVWNDRIFLTSVDASGTLFLLCVEDTGKELWRRTLDTGNQDVRGDEGNSASNSPATDGKHVWAMVASGVIACFTVDGEEIWRFNVADRYGRLDIQFGMTSSPLLDNGKLYLQLIHGEGSADTEEARVVCLDAKTGNDIWTQKRITGATQENEHSYTSPIVYRDNQRSYLVTHGGDYAIAQSLDDGQEIWRYCLNPHGASYHPTLRFVASPVAGEGMIIVPSAKNGPYVAIDAAATGDLPEKGEYVLWRQEKGTPDVPSPLIHDGLVYMCRENGILVCLDAKSGELIYENRLFSDRYRASPIYADGNLYMIARKGVVSVVKAGREFELLAENDMGEPTSSSPVVANGRIYIRTFDALYAIEK